MTCKQMVVAHPGSMAMATAANPRPNSATTPVRCSSPLLVLWTITLLSSTTTIFIASRFSSPPHNAHRHQIGLPHLRDSAVPNPRLVTTNRSTPTPLTTNSIGHGPITGSSPTPTFARDLRYIESPWNTLCFGTPPSRRRLRLAAFVKRWPVGGVPGGLERHALTLHKLLAKRGHSVHVYTMLPGPASNVTQLIDGNLVVHFFPPTPTNNFDHGKALQAFMEHNASQPFHVVHSESVAVPHWRAPEIAAPLVATWHGIAYETVHTDIVMDLVRKPGTERTAEQLKTMSSKLLRVADEVRFFSKYEQHVATSDYVGDVLQTIYELPAARVHTILNGVNASEFYPDPAKGAALRAKHGVPENASLVLGVAGRLVLDKGHGLLIDAFKELIIESSVYLLVAGQGPYEEKYKALAPRVRVLGSLPPAQLAEFYNALDIFVNPTMRAQGLDHTLLEAMQCGKPVLATRFSSITRSVIVRPEFGYTFSPNVAALSEALKLVLADGRNVLRHKGEACRAYATRMFNADKMAASFERLFLCLHNSSYCSYPLAFDRSTCNM